MEENSYKVIAETVAVTLLSIDIIGWWVVLFFWVAPTLARSRGDIAQLVAYGWVPEWILWGLIIFWWIWLPCMVAGCIFVLIIVGKRMRERELESILGRERQKERN